MKNVVTRENKGNSQQPSDKTRNHSYLADAAWQLLSSEQKAIWKDANIAKSTGKLPTSHGKQYDNGGKKEN